MTRTADHPGVIAPPPLIFLATLAAGWGLGWLLRLPDIPATPSIRYAVGGLAVASGLGLAAWSAGAFRRRKTAVQPWKASTALVIEGPYGFSRNPIYVGFAVTYLGFAVAMDSPVALALLIPCLSVIDRFVIAREERYLEGRFKELLLLGRFTLDSQPVRGFFILMSRWLQWICSFKTG